MGHEIPMARLKLNVLDFISIIIKYLMFMAGVLAFLLVVFLFSLIQVRFMPQEIIDGFTALLFIPLIMDLILISPNLPTLLLFFYLIPLLLIIIVIARISLTKILGSGIIQAVSIKPKLGRRRRERKYGLLTLLSVSIGATIGPSTFVLCPNSVKHFGAYALPGMILSSISSILLAYAYGKMYFYSKKLGNKIVGGPSFVGNAFGVKHYLYMVSRFTMWIGNVALAAFNLLIIISLVTEYMLPLFLPWLDLSTNSILYYGLKVALFILLSTIVIVSYEGWEKMVSLQSILTSIFFFLLILHIYFMATYYNVSIIPPLHELNFNPSTSGVESLILGTLTSAAYVYLMVFGFQEVQSLGENVKTKAEKPALMLKEAASILRKAMLGGSLISSIIFILYISMYINMSEKGYEIPSTLIPALDMAKPSYPAFLITLSCISLGILTTYIPAFVAALKHLKELTSDVFFIPIREVRLDPYIIIAFMGLLLLTHSEYIIKLTDFSILISLSIISISELRLRSRFTRTKSKLSLDSIRIIFTSILILSVASIFSTVYQEVAINSIIFMIMSTLVLMFLSYEILMIEVFAVTMMFFSLIITPPLISVISEFASYGMATPADIAIAQALVTTSWIIYFIFIVLLVHIVIEHRQEISKMASGLMLILRTFVNRIVKRAKIR